MTNSHLRVLTVCTGNICRSPMAESVLRRLLDEAGIGDQVTVTSAGISDEEHGNPIDPRARAILVARGYDPLPWHRAHRADATELAAQDLILPMTASHARIVRRQLGPSEPPVVRMYRTFDPALEVNEAKAEDDRYSWDLADPWYGGPEDFREALDQIEAAAPEIVSWMSRHLPATRN